MPQARLVRRDDGTLQVALQRIENTHATKPSAGDQDAIRLLRAGHSHLLVQRSIACSMPIPCRYSSPGGTSHHCRPGSYADAPPAWSRVRTSPKHPPPPGYRRTRAEIPGMDDLRRSPAAPPHSPARWWSPPPLRRVPATAFPRPLRPTVGHPGCCWSCGDHDRRQAHRCELPAAAQQVIFQLHPAAVVAPARPGRPSGYSAACTDTFSGTIAHHSASGTASVPTINMPIRACQPQLSLCVMTCPESGCSRSCLSAGSALL